MAQAISMTSIPGDVAPRYDQGTEIDCVAIVVTEQGTEANLPIVDFKCVGPNGEAYLMVLTGRMVNAIAVYVAAINERNHGTKTP